MENFIAHTNETRQAMLNSISVNTADDLYKHLPILFDNFKMEEPLSELEVQRKMKGLALKNKIHNTSFIGGGAYNKFIPAGVSYIAQRCEFLTAYTPYQPEISQGTLQIIYEYQTMISQITGMDIANASMYDGASACAEAVLMSHRICRGKKNKALINENLNPEYKEVIKTYCWAQNIEIVWFNTLPQDVSEYCCVMYQSPDYYGEIINFEKKNDTILIIVTNLSALAVIEPSRNADIVVGDIQTLGIPLTYGGPHAGFMACKETYMRQLPGRLVGQTLDANGQTAYTLTIQTREQHIKREKATSNICSNQSLIALCTTVYLSLVGEKGFKEINEYCFIYAHKLAQMLTEKGYKLLNNVFFNEFTVDVYDADAFLKKLKENNILGGIKLSSSKVLICVTEMNTEEDICKYIKCL